MHHPSVRPSIRLSIHSPVHLSTFHLLTHHQPSFPSFIVTVVMEAFVEGLPGLCCGGIWGYGAPTTDLICPPGQLPWGLARLSPAVLSQQRGGGSPKPTGGGTQTLSGSLRPPQRFQQQQPPAPSLPVSPSPLRPLALTDTLKRGPIITSRGGPAPFALNLQAALCLALPQAPQQQQPAWWLTSGAEMKASAGLGVHLWALIKSADKCGSGGSAGRHGGVGSGSGFPTSCPLHWAPPGP